MEKLLEKSDASVEKVSGLIPCLANELHKKNEEAVRWMKLHDKSCALVRKLEAVVEKLMDEKAKLLVKHERLVEESVAAVEQQVEAMKKEIEELRAEQPRKKVADD